MPNHNLGTIRGTIEIDYDGAGIVRAIRDTEKVKKSGDGLEKVEKASNKVLSSFAKSTKGAAVFAGALNLVQNVAGLVANTLAIVGPIAAAAFATAPGLVLAFASALIITKVALSGVGDAMKAAAEGGDKFDKALAKLSPQAQKFVKAYQAAIPVLNEVKNSIQDAFFSGAAKNVSGIVTRVASLRAQASGVAFAIGQIVQNVVQFATSGKSIENIRAILSGLNGFLLQIKTSIGPVVQAFISLGAQVSSFGQTLGASVNGALAKLAAWLNSIDIAALFQRALPIIKSLGDTLKNVADIFTTLFSGLTVNGTSAASILAIITGELAAFLHTAQGQSALAALGTAMQAISGAAGQIFLALLQALAPILVALAPGVTVLAGQISGVLVPAIGALAPLLEKMAVFLSANMGWIGPLAGAVVVLAGAYKVYSAATTAVGVAQDILKSKMLGAITVWTLQKIAILGSTAVTVANAVATGVTAVAAWVANTAVVVANRVALIAGQVAMMAVRAATIAWTAVQWLLNAALLANPIGLVVIAIAALVAAIVLAWQHSETFRKIVIAAWDGIRAAAIALWHGVVAAWNGLVAGIQAALSWIASFSRAVWGGIVAGVKGYINAYKNIILAGIALVRTIWSATLGGIKAAASAVWNGIVALVRSAINNIKTIINGVRAIIAVVRGAFNSAKAAAASGIAAMLSLVRSLPGRAAAALSGLGGLLYSKGQALIRGFINGIGSMIGAVRSKVSSVVSAVTRFLPGSPAKEGPLSGQGYVLLRARRFMADFARGIGDGAQLPTQAVMGAVAPMARAVATGGSGGRSRASTTPVVQSPVGGTRVYRVAIGDKEFADLVIDAVTGAPVEVSKAVDEGSRRSAWAGSGR